MHPKLANFVQKNRELQSSPQATSAFIISKISLWITTAIVAPFLKTNNAQNIEESAVLHVRSPNTT